MSFFLRAVNARSRRTSAAAAGAGGCHAARFAVETRRTRPDGGEGVIMKSTMDGSRKRPYVDRLKTAGGNSDAESGFEPSTSGSCTDLNDSTNKRG